MFWIFLTLIQTTLCFICEDDMNRRCSERARRGHCEGRGVNDAYSVAKHMLSQCRKSCNVNYSMCIFIQNFNNLGILL